MRVVGRIGVILLSRERTMCKGKWRGRSRMRMRTHVLLRRAGGLTIVGSLAGVLLWMATDPEARETGIDWRIKRVSGREEPGAWSEVKVKKKVACTKGPVVPYKEKRERL
jgi:H+/Cl- antiporter ClcA